MPQPEKTHFCHGLLGVPQDYVQAHMWYNLASADGGSYASKLRADIARKMTPDQIAEAQALAREWKRTPPGIEGTTIVLPTARPE